MSTICNNCGASNPDGTQFCSQCGSTIASAAPQPQAAPPVSNPYPVQQTNIYQQAAPDVSVLGWIGYLILFAIPVVNIIAMIVVLCSSQNKTLKHFVVAEIVLVVIGIVLWVVLFAALGISLSDFGSNYRY